MNRESDSVSIVIRLLKRVYTSQASLEPDISHALYTRQGKEIDMQLFLTGIVIESPALSIESVQVFRGRLSRSKMLQIEE